MTVFESARARHKIGCLCVCEMMMMMILMMMILMMMSNATEEDVYEDRGKD